MPILFAVLGLSAAFVLLLVSKAKAGGLTGTIDQAKAANTASAFTGIEQASQAQAIKPSSYGDLGAQLGSKVPIVGAPIGRTIGGAVGEITSGNITPRNVATVAFFPVAVTATAINAVSDLLGFSGKPLDAVEDVLLTNIKDPAIRNNIDGQGPGIWVLDTNGYRHYTGKINEYGYSWRAIIAINPSKLSEIPISPMDCARFKTQEPWTVQKRPARAEDIRTIFGNDCMFKIGADNTVRGPWELN